MEEGNKSKQIYVSQKRKTIREGKKSKKQKGFARIPHLVNTQGKASSGSASTTAFLLPYSSPTPVFLPGESQGRGNLVGCRLWGRTESDTTEAT